MDKAYSDSLQSILDDECTLYGELIAIDGVELKALVSTSPTTKNLQIAGYYKSKTLDVIIPSGKVTSEINNIVLYKQDNFYVKMIEELIYDHGYRFTMELVR